MKRIAVGALWFTLVVQSGYLIVSLVVLHASWGHLVQPFAFFILFGALAITRGSLRWINTLARWVIGAEFALSIADRFGWMGPPGDWVSWGDFAHFVIYTRQVNAFLPASLAPLLAVLATIGESVLGVTLILGVALPWATRGAALLLFFFGSAMTASGMAEGQFFYAVFVLAAGAWVLSTVDASWLSIDGLVRHRAAVPPTEP